MEKYSVMSLFCEDIRIEKNDQRTLVGVLNDALDVSKFPGALPRLGIFTRLSASVDFDIHDFAVRFLNSKGELIAESIVEKDLIDRSREQARTKGNPTYGIISQFQLIMFSLESEGICPVNCTVNGTEKMSGYINVRLSPPSNG
jgi:hypothetical protein